MMMQRVRVLSLLCFLILLAQPLLTWSDEPALSAITVTSPYQPTPQRVRILRSGATLNPECSLTQPITLVYVLPVEPGSQTRWGDAVKAIREAGGVEKSNVVFVFPEFAQLPWYADHPTEKTIAQESYFLKSVIPAVDKHLVLEPRQCRRMLIGFSKSGWGAFCLLLRHPETFEKAVAWDAPLMMDAPGKYGSGPIFGTPENFKNYQVSELLSQTDIENFGKETRLISLGYDNFRDHHLRIHKLMQELKIPHIHRDGPQRKHHWESGWVKEAVDFLLVDPAQ
ncbi:MAG: hypothetical protein HUJ26_18475 [Planctomycetaceae bacterium]|nr:hypothetical protein [Planctomycetaceae bacterium]